MMQPLFKLRLWEPTEMTVFHIDKGSKCYLNLKVRQRDNYAVRSAGGTAERGAFQFVCLWIPPHFGQSTEAAAARG